VLYFIYINVLYNNLLYRVIKKMSLYGSWVPGLKQEIALVNLDPRSLTGTFFGNALQILNMVIYLLFANERHEI
jgi:hypothetical protein